MTRFSYRKRKPFLNKNIKKKNLDHTLVGHEFRNSVSYKHSVESEYFLHLYMSTCRGLQRRNWTSVKIFLQKSKCPKELLEVIFQSWVKFKFARALRPHMSQTYVYILKNFSTLEGQKIYDDCYEQYTEQPYLTTKTFYDLRGRDSRYYRLMEYFYNEEPEWILPLVVFPRIDFEKSKMHYCDEPYEIDMDMIKEVQEKVFNYVLSLDIDQLMIPRGDLMSKYGTQKYNDGGVVREDYERPTNSFDSSFLYQRFLTQPLTPREVWLPGKAIKQNNAFMMTVHRQILKRDPLYPSIDMEDNVNTIKKYLSYGMLKFDISGFGFQYLREWLIAGNNAIRELYPCSDMEEQSEIFERILKDVTVEMPDGSFKKPLRGIGLGYYEDLKTIVMIALLKDHFPISVYGDQGLIEKRGIEFCFDLMKYSFIMNYEKIDEGSSEGRLRWGGIIFEGDSYIRPRLYSDSIFGSFFAVHHWERKASLYSVSQHYPEMYKSIEKRLIGMYKTIYGYEFYNGELDTSFLNGGISMKPKGAGLQRLYNIRSFMSPISMLTFDPIYQTPFNLISKPQVSYKESKKFQKKRKNLYKTQEPKDSHLYDYVNPVLEFNKKQPIVERTLPRWADLNLILNHGLTSGSITCGLRGEEIMKAAERQHFSSDPFRARATGGYSFVTKWRSSRPAPSEWIEAAEALQNCGDLYPLWIKRNDLIQNPMAMHDDFYKDTDLFKHIVVEKRKRNPSSYGDEIELRDRLYQDVTNMLPSLLKRHKVNNFADIVQLAKDKLDGYDDHYQNIDNNSEYGQIEDDDIFFGDDIDIMNLE